MDNLIQTIMYLLIGYLVGIWLAAPGIFSWTVSATQWGNILVYVYMLFWPFILLFHFVLWIIAIVLIFIVVAMILERYS